MLRICFSLFVSVTVARWIYSEAEIIAPSVLPAIDYVLESTQIPTHDKWSQDSLAQILNVAHGVTVAAKTAFIPEKKGEQTHRYAKKGPSGTERLKELAKNLAAGERPTEESLLRY